MGSAYSGDHMEFPTTRWDELARASLHGDDGARRALDELCKRYWAPVNQFIVWKGHDAVDAADLAQDFFLNFLETRSWRRADPLRGSFRSFLLGALTHRLQKAHAHQTRLKRGGNAVLASLDELDETEDTVPASIQVPAVDAVQFDRAWAVRVLDAALDATRASYAARGKEAVYAALKGFLTVRRSPPSYEEVAQVLGLHPAALKTEIHRLRQAFREALRMEISRTVSAPHEIEAEFQHLRAVLSDGRNET